MTEWGFYNVTVTNNLGCTGQASIGILSGQVPVFNIIPSSPSICPGQSDTLRLSGGFFSPQWSNGTVGHINIVNQPGTYSVTVTNSFGCTGTESITIQPLPTPVIQVASTPPVSYTHLDVYKRQVSLMSNAKKSNVRVLTLT